MNTIADAIVASLSEFAAKLESGERIMVTTIERCGCQTVTVSPHNNKCHLCNGTGWIHGAKTLFASGSSK